MSPMLHDMMMVTGIVGIVLGCFLIAASVSFIYGIGKIPNPIPAKWYRFVLQLIGRKPVTEIPPRVLRIIENSIRKHQIGRLHISLDDENYLWNWCTLVECFTILSPTVEVIAHEAKRFLNNIHNGMINQPPTIPIRVIQILRRKNAGLLISDADIFEVCFWCNHTLDGMQHFRQRKRMQIGLFAAHDNI